jgi:4a-hydroxytetrahydrobiopterin dehydratase
MARLSDEEVEQGLEGLAWRRDGDTIVHDRELADFGEAMALVDVVAEAAEAANRHPDILVHGSNKVRFTLSTRAEGGLTQADLDLARRIDGLGPH